MMSFVEVSQFNIVKKLFYLKIQRNVSLLGSLIFLQILGMLFAFLSSSSGFFGSEISIEILYVSTSSIIAFTLLWIFIVAILTTVKEVRYEDFSFVTNRFTSNMANILFLLTASIVGGITAGFSDYLVRTIAYFIFDIKVGNTIFEAPEDLLILIFGAFLYGLLFAGIGYIVGMLIQIHPIFIILLPALLVGVMMIGLTTGYVEQVKAVFDFIFKENHIGLFLLKVLAVSGGCFLLATLLANRLEVRK